MSFHIKPSTLTLRASTRPLRTHLRPLTTTIPTLDPKAQQKQREREREIIENFERHILSPERAETAYSGTDNAVGEDNYAYDPSVTNPEGEFQCFEEEVRNDGRVDPLFISPANREFSRLLDRELDGRAVGRDKGDRLGAGGSVRGWVKKGKEVRIRGPGEGGKRGGEDEYERLLRGLRKLQMRDKAAFPADQSGDKGREKGV
ncbi:hypothetical protein BJX76DRAFT_361402 [Aspergillus varians]